VTEVFRLVRAGRSTDALSGEGARLYGGCWNPPGVAVVYASESRALAVLETFVHLTAEARGMRFVLYTLALPKKPALTHAPPARRARSIGATQRIGAGWAAERSTLGLAVPSVIVPQETNYVLNVAHTQFAAVRIVDAEKFSFDERLFSTRNTAVS
jgi:RES domain-containing protein